MLLNSVVVVLREVLEAILLLSVLLSTSRFLRLSSRWVLFALLFGFIGAAIYGYYLQSVSDLFDGVGQEVFNALLQISVFVALVLIVFFIACEIGRPLRHDSILRAFMATAMILTITREGSEILIYVSGFWQLRDFLSAVGIGTLIGASIGCSVGVLFYFLLLSQPDRRGLQISLVLLALIAAGMCAQATKLLIQADWISTAGAIWDTSGFLPEYSLTGQLLYALIGYEASPSATEVTIYVGSLSVITASYAAGRLIFGSGRENI